MQWQIVCTTICLWIDDYAGIGSQVCGAAIYHCVQDATAIAGAYLIDGQANFSATSFYLAVWSLRNFENEFFSSPLGRFVQTSSYVVVNSQGSA